jgi:hypothetical protein
MHTPTPPMGSRMNQLACGLNGTLVPLTMQGLSRPVAGNLLLSDVYAVTS